ncbi:hypothetical protein NQ318_015879 [Aromia moschata]|uniref:Tetraspanin n=1 Tax=Aromia moschata TaxID=1265417 RepID=A0AAV8XZX2_9CUCU|nr:hypothetical protein NQ318_015879 [Aromia moschata]
MGAGYTCMKFLFIVLNIIFLLFSLAGIGAAIWMFVDPSIPLHFTQEANDYLVSVIIILLASIILFIVSILGIYSVSKEAKKALVASFCLLLIIVVAEVAAGVWGYTNRDSLELHIKTSIRRTVREDYYRDDSMKRSFDVIQSKMHCCGAEGPIDWTKEKELSMSISADAVRYRIPASCCRPEYENKEDCIKATNLAFGSKLNMTVIYDKGCYSLIMSELTENICVIMIIGGVILAVQVLGLILALILACSMNRSHRYKA